MKRHNGSGKGVATIIFAIKRILEERSDQPEFSLNPVVFGRIVEERPLFSRRDPLSQSDIRIYKNQLMSARDHWPSDSEWRVRESTGSRFKLIFRQKEKTDNGKR